MLSSILTRCLVKMTLQASARLDFQTQFSHSCKKADKALLSAVPNWAKTFSSSFVSFLLEVMPVSLEEGCSVSHWVTQWWFIPSLNLFIQVCYKYMDDLENKSWLLFCMEGDTEYCSMTFPALILGESVYCGRWSKYSQLSKFQMLSYRSFCRWVKTDYGWRLAPTVRLQVSKVICCGKREQNWIWGEHCVDTRAPFWGAHCEDTSTRSEEIKSAVLYSLCARVLKNLSWAWNSILLCGAGIISLIKAKPEQRFNFPAWVQTAWAITCTCSWAAASNSHNCSSSTVAFRLIFS